MSKCKILLLLLFTVGCNEPVFHDETYFREYASDRKVQLDNLTRKMEYEKLLMLLRRYPKQCATAAVMKSMVNPIVMADGPTIPVIEGDYTWTAFCDHILCKEPCILPTEFFVETYRMHDMKPAECILMVAYASDPAMGLKSRRELYVRLYLDITGGTYRKDLKAGDQIVSILQGLSAKGKESVCGIRIVRMIQAISFTGRPAESSATSISSSGSFPKGDTASGRK
jgi:hypothetical protein